MIFASPPEADPEPEAHQPMAELSAENVPSQALVPLLGIPPKKRNPRKRDLRDDTSPTDPSVWRGGEQTRPNDR